MKWLAASDIWRLTSLIHTSAVVCCRQGYCCLLHEELLVLLLTWLNRGPAALVGQQHFMSACRCLLWRSHSQLLQHGGWCHNQPCFDSCCWA